MNPDLYFLTLDDVLDIHEWQQTRFGGAAGIRGMGLLDSAVAQPQTTFQGNYLHSNLFQMASAYAFHIAENQPFIDGNKRTALIAALTFLELNGVTVIDDSNELYLAMMSVADGSWNKNDLAELFNKLASNNPDF